MDMSGYEETGESTDFSSIYDLETVSYNQGEKPGPAIVRQLETAESPDGVDAFLGNNNTDPVV